MLFPGGKGEPQELRSGWSASAADRQQGKHGDPIHCACTARSKQRIHTTSRQFTIYYYLQCKHLPDVLNSTSWVLAVLNCGPL